MPFVIWHLKKHFLVVENVITFTFSTKVPWGFTREGWDKVITLGFFINYIVKWLFATAGTIPKFNGIVVVFLKKLSKFTKYSCWLNLIWVGQWIKYFLCSMDRVCNNKDTFDIRKTGSLINTASYCKEFSFSGCDINHIMYSLND